MPEINIDISVAYMDINIDNIAGNVGINVDNNEPKLVVNLYYFTAMYHTSKSIMILFNPVFYFNISDVVIQQWNVACK